MVEKTWASNPEELQAIQAPTRRKGDRSISGRLFWGEPTFLRLGVTVIVRKPKGIPPLVSLCPLNILRAHVGDKGQNNERSTRGPKSLIARQNVQRDFNGPHPRRVLVLGKREANQKGNCVTGCSVVAGGAETVP